MSSCLVVGVFFDPWLELVVVDERHVGRQHHQLLAETCGVGIVKVSHDCVGQNGTRHALSLRYWWGPDPEAERRHVMLISNEALSLAMT